MKKVLFRPKSGFLSTVFMSFALLSILELIGISVASAQEPKLTQTPVPNVQRTTEQIMTMQSQITATNEPHQALNPGRRNTPVPQNPESPQTSSIGDGASIGAQSSLWQIIVVMLIVVVILVKVEFKI